MPPRKEKTSRQNGVSTLQLVREVKKSLKNKLRQARASSKALKNKQKGPRHRTQSKPLTFVKEIILLGENMSLIMGELRRFLFPNSSRLYFSRLEAGDWMLVSPFAVLSPPSLA